MVRKESGSACHHKRRPPMAKQVAELEKREPKLLPVIVLAPKKPTIPPKPQLRTSNAYDPWESVT
jgi:hypothetical protein